MTTLIAVTVKSGAILLAAVVALPFLRRQSAALRHLVLMAAIVAATALPLVSLVFPAWHLPAPVVSSCRDSIRPRPRRRCARQRPRGASRQTPHQPFTQSRRRHASGGCNGSWLCG